VPRVFANSGKGGGRGRNKAVIRARWGIIFVVSVGFFHPKGDGHGKGKRGWGVRSDRMVEGRETTEEGGRHDRGQGREEKRGGGDKSMVTYSGKANWSSQDLRGRREGSINQICTWICQGLGIIASGTRQLTTSVVSFIFYLFLFLRNNFMHLFIYVLIFLVRLI
jgi:hypothetical protein